MYMSIQCHNNLLCWSRVHFCLICKFCSLKSVGTWMPGVGLTLSLVCVPCQGPRPRMTWTPRPLATSTSQSPMSSYKCCLDNRHPQQPPAATAVGATVAKARCSCEGGCPTPCAASQCQGPQTPPPLLLTHLSTHLSLRSR